MKKCSILSAIKELNYARPFSHLPGWQQCRYAIWRGGESSGKGDQPPVGRGSWDTHLQSQQQCAAAASDGRTSLGRDANSDDNNGRFKEP